MSANRKSVFLSEESLSIVGPFTSGRLNSIIERYGYLLKTQDISDVFSPSQLALIYQVTKERAIKERESWRQFHSITLRDLLNTVKTEDNRRDIDEMIDTINELKPLQWVALIDAIEMFWADERVRLFQAYQLRKKQP